MQQPEASDPVLHVAAEFGTPRARRSALSIRVSSPTADTVLAFTGVAQRIGMPLEEFAAVLAPFGVNTVFVKDLGNRAYLSRMPMLGERTADISARIRAHLPGNGVVVGAVGNSGGGPGAIIYGTLLGARRILAFCPATRVTPAQLAKWREADPTLPPMDELAYGGDLRNLLMATAHPPIEIHTGLVPNDLAQAAHLADLPGVTVVTHEAQTHALPVWLARQGLLRDIVQRALDLPTP